MSLRKVADYRIAQRPNAGYVLFKLTNPDGSITDWIGWQYVPPAQLASLHSILMTGNAYYDDALRIFTTGGATAAAMGDAAGALALDPTGVIPIQQAKTTKKVARGKKLNNKA